MNTTMNTTTTPATTLAVTPAETMPTDDAIKLFFANGVKAKTKKTLETELQIFNYEHNATLWDGDFYGNLPLPDARPAKPFANVIESAFAHVSHDDNRQEMFCVKIEDGKAIATDGHRLFVAPCNDLPDGLWKEVEKEYSFFFDGKSEKDIKEWIDGECRTNEEAKAMCHCFSKDFSCHYPKKIGKKWYHNNVTTNFPNYRDVIPEHGSSAYRLDNAESLLPRLTSTVNFHKMLTNNDLKAAMVYIGGMSMSFNPKFLLEAIRALSYFGSVTMSASSELVPVTLTAGDAMVVLMPKREVTGVALNATPAVECLTPEECKQPPKGAVVDFPGGRRLVVTENKVVAVEEKAPSAPEVAAPVAINAAECGRGKGHSTIKDAIVADLKAAGYNSRQVSVKHKGAYYVTIRDASIPGEQIREIAERHERITRDEGTGEILSGGNSFVFVERADGCFPPFEEIARAVVSAAKAVKESHSEVIKLSHTYFVTKSHGNLYEVTNSDGPNGRFCYRFDYNDPEYASGAARAIALHEQDLQYLDGKTPAAECADCAAAVSNAIAPIENAAPVTPPPLPLRYRLVCRARNSKPWRIAALVGAAVAGVYAVLSN